mmetsp:Transcript_10971/g.15693  ORF Transcript_10971/g.15693 Transcript_10971/m.15693 type:complete len:90 (+) Transcript_10971:140-409(+)
MACWLVLSGSYLFPSIFGSRLIVITDLESNSHVDEGDALLGSKMPRGGTHDTAIDWCWCGFTSLFISRQGQTFGSVESVIFIIGKRLQV